MRHQGSQMSWNGPINKLDAFRYEIPRSYKTAMRTSGHIFSDEKMMQQIKGDNAAEQVANVATIPGIVGKSMAMPDIHWGYGFPIGGVAATDADEGVLSPGGVGFDINCGVRLVRTDLTVADVRPKIREIVDSMFTNVPSGLGSKGKVRLTGFPAWLLWSVAHVYFLIGNRSRLAVAINWLWAYLTFERGARLITHGESFAPSAPAQAEQPIQPPLMAVGSTRR